MTLLSAPGAALYAGCGWWRALAEAARATHPDIPAEDILDCADAPGRAMEALRLGQKRLILRPCPAWDAVEAAARECGATLLRDRPPALDLARPGAMRHLSAWLAGEVTEAPR